MNLAFDLSNRVLITSWVGGPQGLASALPAFFNTDYLPVQIYVEIPTGLAGGQNALYVTAPGMSAYTMQVSIGQDLQATDETGLIVLGTLTWNSTLNCFTGNLNFSGATAIIGAKTKDVFWFNAVLLSATGVPTVVYQSGQENIPVWANLNPGSTAPPAAPPNTYATLQQLYQLFVPILGVKGGGFWMQDSDGNAIQIFAQAGQLKADAGTIPPQ